MKNKKDKNKKQLPDENIVQSADEQINEKNNSNIIFFDKVLSSITYFLIFFQKNC